MMQDTLKGITIDDATTRDMDDAIRVERVEGDGWHVVVMIADVAKAVPAGSGADRAAMARAETRYYAGGNSPMLPRHLADDELSLWPGKPRAVIAIDITLDAGLAVLDTGLSGGTMDSEARLSYSDIPGILSDPGHPRHAIVEQAGLLANGLLMLRRDRGALVFYDLNRGLVTGEEGSLKKLKSREDTIGYIMIQELMILANTAVAEYAAANDIPILFRNHTGRSATPEREDLMRLLESAAVAPAENLAAIRHTTHLMFNKAEYGASVLGHFGLNLGAYTHFTSPIRRYADLVNHRQIRAHINGEPSPYTKEDIRTIAAHINRTLADHDKARSEHMREKAHRKAEASIRSDRIEGLDDREFERVTKLLVCSGADCSQAYYDAFLERADAGRLPMVCAGLVMIQAPGNERWTGLKAALLERLAAEPNKAVTIFSLAGQMAGWPMPAYDVAEARSGSLPIFAARAAIELGDKRHESAEFKGMTRKGAMQRASVGLLALVLGLPVPEMKAVQAAPPVEKAVAINAAKDPIVALQEYCQARKLPLPDYSYRMEGSPHRPTITCTCTFDSATSTGQASSKQRAKRLSAKAMVYMLAGIGD